METGRKMLSSSSSSSSKYIMSYYLGSVIAEDGRCMDDIKQRIGCAKDAFNKRKELLSKSMNKALKKRIVKVLVWPVALYGCETWVMKKEAIDRLEAFEMWIWRKLEKVSWEDKQEDEGQTKDWDD